MTAKNRTSKRNLTSKEQVALDVVKGQTTRACWTLGI